MSKLGIIQVTEDARCELCREIKELRPYGPNGENICFDCGMKDVEAAKRGFRKLVLGEGNA